MKKTIPFDLLKLVEEIYRINADVLEVNKPENSFYHFYDKENSNFYYNILRDPSKNFNSPNPKYFYVVSFPKNENQLTKSIDNFLTAADLSEHFKSWIRIIRLFNETNSIYDDPFIKTYQRFFYDEIKIIDVDAEVVPFDPDKQEKLGVYLDYIEAILLEEKTSSEDEDVLKEIISDVQNTKKDLNTLSKNKVISRISRIWAKVYKWNKEQAKEIIKKAKEELLKEVIKRAINNLPEIIDTVQKHIP